MGIDVIDQKTTHSLTGPAHGRLTVTAAHAHLAQCPGRKINPHPILPPRHWACGYACGYAIHKNICSRAFDSTEIYECFWTSAFASILQSLLLTEPAPARAHAHPFLRAQASGHNPCWLHGAHPDRTRGSCPGRPRCAPKLRAATRAQGSDVRLSITVDVFSISSRASIFSCPDRDSGTRERPTAALAVLGQAGGGKGDPPTHRQAAGSANPPRRESKILGNDSTVCTSILTFILSRKSLGGVC